MKAKRFIDYSEYREAVNLVTPMSKQEFYMSMSYQHSTTLKGKFDKIRKFFPRICKGVLLIGISYLTRFLGDSLLSLLYGFLSFLSPVFYFFSWIVGFVGFCVLVPSTFSFLFTVVTIPFEKTDESIRARQGRNEYLIALRKHQKERAESEKLVEEYNKQERLEIAKNELERLEKERVEQKKKLRSKNCPRCGGSGYLPQYAHVQFGRCFRCNG